MNKVMNNFKKQSKLRLIELDNENVTSPDTQKNLKTPEKSTSLAFFFILIFNVFSMSVQCLLLRCISKLKRNKKMI